MIIAIDGYEANVKNRVGIGRYAYEIIKYLSFTFRYPLSYLSPDALLICLRKPRGGSIA